MKTLSLDESLAAIVAAVKDGKLSRPAAENIRRWLKESRYEAFRAELIGQLTSGSWAALEDAFWTVLPFGTAGRRGPMYPIGTAAINDRTIGESAQGLADFVRQKIGAQAPAHCAVAYDTRHRSRHFAELCCEVMAAAGFRVFFLDGHRSTPELSFSVRQLGCHCGIMISASHNPPRDNAIKVFGANGGQFRSPDDAELMRCVAAVIDVGRSAFAAEKRNGRIECCQNEIDSRYQSAVLSQSFAGPCALKILYSPLHGVGLTSVLPVLHADGFTDVEVFGPHAEPNGDFLNVSNGCANPEDPSVFTDLIARAEQTGADLVLASDPDADRIGCAAPTTPGGRWQVISGNQIGALLADYILRRRRAAGTLSERHYIVKTLVTSEMVRRVADSHGVTTFGDVLTGFKWISGIVDEQGPERFVFGCEEAHGFMVGDYVRDKDAAVAAMLLAELAADLKSQRRTLWQELDRLHAAVGYHAERTLTRTLPGADGLKKMERIMNRLRREPPMKLANLRVRQVRDYLRGSQTSSSGETIPLPGPRGDLLFFDLETAGNCVAVRPSGTEPKLKFYLFGYRPPHSSQDLQQVRAEVQRQLDEVELDLLRAAEA